MTREKKRLLELQEWIENNPEKFDGVIERSGIILQILAANPNLDPIQDRCKYGYVLPDRCRYIGRNGCDCGAYPPLKEPVK